MTDITTRARALLAAATPGPWEADAWYNCDDGGWAAIGPHHMATEDEGCDDVPESPAHHRAMADAALIAAAPELLAALCDELEASARRNLNQVGLIDAWAGKCERVEAERDALQAEMARLRSDLDIEREQSAKFVKEIELLKAGIADAERWAAQSTASEAVALGVIKRAALDMLRIPVSIEALAVSAIRQNLSDFRPSMAGSRMLDRLRAIETERDALRAEVERLKARRAEMCDCVNHSEINANYTDDDCPKCGGSGGVITEGEK